MSTHNTFIQYNAKFVVKEKKRSKRDTKKPEKLNYPLADDMTPYLKAPKELT